MTRAQVAAIAAVALLLSSCGSRVRNWPSDSATPAPNDEVAVRTTLADMAATETTTAANSGKTSKTNTSSTMGTVVTAAEIPAPPDGTYTYDVVTDFPAFEDEPAETFRSATRVTWRSTRAAGVVSSEARQADVEDDSSAATSSYRTTSASHELLKTSYSDDEGEATCAYSPPQVLMQLPLRVGAKWHSDSTCKDGDYVEGFALDGEVVSSTNDTVGGKTVKTFVIKFVEKYTETDTTDPDPENVFSSRIERTTHIDPTTLLIVSDEERNVEDEYVFTTRRSLRSIEPRSA